MPISISVSIAACKRCATLCWDPGRTSSSPPPSPSTRTGADTSYIVAVDNPGLCMANIKRIRSFTETVTVVPSRFMAPPCTCGKKGLALKFHNIKNRTRCTSCSSRTRSTSCTSCIVGMCTRDLTSSGCYGSQVQDLDPKWSRFEFLQTVRRS